MIHVSVKDEVVLERLQGRLVHKDSGRTYHELYNPPVRAGLDNVT